jgi:N-acetylneuraminic acid mutarotase
VVGGLAVVVAGLAVASVVTELPGPPLRRWLGLGETVDITCEPTATSSRSPATPPPPAGAWQAEPELPGSPAPELDAAVVDGSVYLVGGLTDDGASLVPVSVDRLLVYDARTQEYREAPDLPARVDHALAVAHDGALYVAGGFRDGVPVAELWRLDLVERAWSELPPLRQARGALAGAVIGGRLYALGGAGATSPTGFVDAFATLEVYDFASETWSFGPDMPTPRHHFAAVELGGDLYAVGGRNADSLVLDALERFDPETGQWETFDPLPAGTGSPDAASTGAAIVVTGGGNDVYDDPSGYVTPASWAYLPGSGWRRLPDLTEARHGHAAAFVDGRVIAFGGAPCAGFGLLSSVESLELPADLVP